MLKKGVKWLNRNFSICTFNRNKKNHALKTLGFLEVYTFETV